MKHIINTVIGQYEDFRRRNVIKLAFTWFLDKMMTKNGSVFYFDQPIMRQRLATRGFHVIELPINDWLPYPHIVIYRGQVTSSREFGCLPINGILAF
jgi:hypothetical protein